MGDFSSETTASEASQRGRMLDYILIDDSFFSPQPLFEGVPLRITDPKGHARPVKAMAWSCDGKLLATGGEDRNVKIWEHKVRRKYRQGFMKLTYRLFDCTAPPRPNVWISTGSLRAVDSRRSLACRGHSGVRLCQQQQADHSRRHYPARRFRPSRPKYSRCYLAC